MSKFGSDQMWHRPLFPGRWRVRCLCGKWSARAFTVPGAVNKWNRQHMKQYEL